MASHDLFGRVVLMGSDLLLSLLMGWVAPQQLREDLSSLPQPLLLGGVLALSRMEIIQPKLSLWF